MKKKINILIIGMSPAYGGIESFIINVFRRVDKTAFNIDFLSFYPECAFEQEITQANSKVFHLTRRGKNPVKNYFELKSFFKNHKDDYDFVWINLSSSSNITSNVMARRYTNSKIISHSHGTSFESSRIMRPIHKFLDKFNFKKFMRCTDYCFACSNAAGNYLFNGFAQSVKIIKNGIETDKYKFNTDIRKRVRDEFGANDETKIIGHAGRLCPIKNQEFIIDVFYELQKNEENSLLIIAGDGELKNQLIKKSVTLGIQDKVKLVGFRDDFNRLIQAFDLFILPSFNEGFPVTLIEAQSGGLPCLVSDSVTNEAKVTELVHFKSLNSSSREWADEIIKILSESGSLQDRDSFVSQIKTNGLDVNSTVKDLEEFFSNN